MASARSARRSGRCVEVAELFYNVPARLKFLKADATEATHVTELVARIAMAHPDLHVKLRHNGRTALDAPPDRDGFARAKSLLGPRVTDRMVVASGEEAGVRVTCMLGAPELALTTARGVQLFVGRRPVRDRGLLHAVAMGYGELVARGRYPVAIVLLDAPAHAVDVNVHPQKAEVRFADAGAVCAAVRHVVQLGIARAPWRDELAGVGPVMMTAIASVVPPRLPFDAPATASTQTYASQLRDARNTGSLAQERLGFDGSASAWRRGSSDAGPRAWVQGVKDHVRTSRVAEAELAGRALAAARKTELATTWRDGVAADARHDCDASIVEHDERSSCSSYDERDDADADLAVGSAPIESPPAVARMAGGFFSSLRFLGQLDLTYLVCEADGELVLIDQHIAHERVELARLKGAGRSQLARRAAHVVPDDDRRSARARRGSPASSPACSRRSASRPTAAARTLAVTSVPGGIRHGDPAQLLARPARDVVGRRRAERGRAARARARRDRVSLGRARGRSTVAERSRGVAPCDGRCRLLHDRPARPAGAVTAAAVRNRAAVRPMTFERYTR